eukprot:gene499-1145_t
MKKSRASLGGNLAVNSAWSTHSLRSSLQSLDQQAPLESMLHPSIFFENIHSRQTKKGLYPKNQTRSITNPKHLITLQQAARDGRIDIVRIHIEKAGRDKKKLNKKDQEQTTALHYAVRYNHMSIVKLLVESGANVNVPGEYGATPLHYAARYRKNQTQGIASTAFQSALAAPLFNNRRKDYRLKTLRNLVTYGARRRSSALRGKVAKNRSDGAARGNKMKGGKVNTRQRVMQRLLKPFVSRSNVARGKDAAGADFEGEQKVDDGGNGVELNERKSLIEFEGVVANTSETGFSGSDNQRAIPHIVQERATPERSLGNNAVFSNDYDDYDFEDELSQSGSVFAVRPEVLDGISLSRSDVGPTDVNRVRGQTLKLSPDGDEVALRTVSVKLPSKSLSMPDIKSLDLENADSITFYQQEEAGAKDIPLEFEAVRIGKEAKPINRSSTYSTSGGKKLLQPNKAEFDKDIGPGEGMMEGRSLDTLILKKVGKAIVGKPDESIILYLLSKNANVNATDFYGATPLHYAAQRSNPVAVNELLTRSNIDIEAKDRTQMTAMHCAASNGSLQVTKILIEHGADLRCTDEEDIRPLHFAAMEGNLDIVRMLFEAGEDTGGWHTLSRMILDEDRDGQTALHLAVENGHVEIVKVCLEKGANVNHFNTNLITPLHLAATSGNLEIAHILVEHGANIEVTNALQETPLHRAALFNRCNIVTYLLDCHAKIDCRDKDQETPLMMAVRRNNTLVVKLLISLGADVTLKDSDDRTCLFIAAEEDCVDTLKFLLEHSKAQQLLDEFDERENTPLHVAASKGFIKIVKILLQRNACIDAKNDQNLTPLHLAAKYGRARIVEILLKQDLVIVNDEDDTSNTPLHLAALEGHTRVVQTLLTSGAAVDARNANMWTPLDCAASRGWTKCAEALLEGDSPIDPMDRGKTTPLHLASREGHADMVKLLLDEKADISRKDHAGRNCLDLAIENNQREAALAIINNENWKLALRNSTPDGDSVTTPLRKLINKLPDVAERVFYRCVVNNGLPVEHPDYEIMCNYEFLEDANTEWGMDLVHLKHETRPHRKKSMISGVRVPGTGYAKKQFELKDNHPLMIMVRSQCTKLLCHPLVSCLLRHKWRSYGRYVYYTKLLLYVFYLMFLTGYALFTVQTNQAFTCRAGSANTTQCFCVSDEKPITAAKHLWVDFGKWVVIILASLGLLVEVIQMITLLHNYIRIHNIIEFGSYLTSVFYILDAFTWNGNRIEIIKYGRCRYWHRSIGACTVWLSWISLVLFMRKFPKLGIYVVMFTDIMKTFAQFFLVFTLFIIAFGLGFHMLLFEHKPYAFASPARSILKTSMGMLGEFEYDTVFNENHPMPLAWGIYVLYLIINCIILMNLLVGLAVDDIKGVQENAVLKRYAMQIDLALDVEKALPLTLRKKLLQIEEHIQPNAVRAWHFWAFWGSPFKPQTTTQQGPIERLQSRQDELRETVKSLRRNVKNIQTQNKRLELMLGAILKHHSINVDYEVDDNDEKM